MKIVEQSAELIQELNPLKKIERIGRTCYKSEELITEKSAPKFVQGLFNRKHFAMLEHAVFTFVLPKTLYDDDYAHNVVPNKFCNYSFLTDTECEVLCVAGPTVVASINLRVMAEDFQSSLVNAARRILYKSSSEIANLLRMDDTCDIPLVGYLVEDVQAELPERIRADHSFTTMKFITDRGVSHELVRHRVASFAQSSTRYCNYAADKFGNEVTFVQPSTWDELDNSARISIRDAFKYAEQAYLELINDCNLKPQQARAVLPNGLMTEIVITASATEWQHIGNLRYFGTTGAPHPDMRALMAKALEACPTVFGGVAHV